MVVQTQDKRPGVVGLHIGKVNVRKHFPRDMQLIELELDHLRIACPLKPSFWHDDPEIHDFRLSSWLESKRTSGRLSSPSAPVALIPCGAHSFRLQLIRKSDSDSSVVKARSASDINCVVGETVPGTVRKSRERRVDRLKNDESPSPSAHN